jgi:hypothetical protein
MAAAPAIAERDALVAAAGRLRAEVQRRLGARRGAIDLVGQHDVREDRSTHESERACAGRRILLENLRARDVAGNEIGGELNPPKLELDGLGE